MIPQTLRHSRRNVLRGLGLTLGLPFFESLMPRTSGCDAAAWKPPLRAAFLHFPNGMWEADWVPKDTGRNYTLSRTLTPLADVRDEVLVVTGLDKQHSRDGDGHYSKLANFLTGMPVRKTTGKNISAGGVSVDQVMARSFRNQTVLPSLVLGGGAVDTGIDRSVGYTHAYGSYISWESETRPITPAINPRVVYETLFGIRRADGNNRAAASRNLLDFMLEDARALRGQLGRDDQHKLNEYLDSVREVESRVEFFRQHASSLQRPVVDRAFIDSARPPRKPADFREYIRIMLELLALAFQTDSTRVCSMLLAGGISDRSFRFLEGVTGEHHQMSHHQNDPDRIEQYQKITQWYVGVFADFLKKLKSIPEGEGTLLDSCMILFGSCMSDGNTHDPDNLPILVGGRARGTLETGQHIAATSGSVPLCNLYLSMLDRMGIELESFGDSTGRLI